MFSVCVLCVCSLCVFSVCVNTYASEQVYLFVCVLASECILCVCVCVLASECIFCMFEYMYGCV